MQDLLLEWGTKFRPIRPAAPHLNGKVERAQKTILDEFYPTVDLKGVDLPDDLKAWQFYYNWLRVHGSLGKTPIERCTELSAKTPLTDEVCEAFNEDREREIHGQRPLRGGRRN